MFQLTEYGAEVSAAPRLVHESAPAGEVWNWAEATPVPRSAESAVTLTVPLTIAPLAGAVSEPVGEVSSTVTELLAALVAVQVWKTAVTRQVNVPSPRTSVQSSAAVGFEASVPQAPLQSEPVASRRSM